MEKAKAVLVTGASSGIGRAVCERLAAANYFVYAGARKEVDLHVLGKIKNVQALRLDVTSSEDIAAAVNTVANEGRGLNSLVNNAGIATSSSVISSNDREFDLVMAVNVCGTYRVTKAFAPQIIAGKGRIVVVGSISGILADKNTSAYSMSKHAVEAFADSLAAEMASFEVHVSLIEPGKFNTNLVKSALDRMNVDIPMPDLSSYGDPDDVAAAIELALFEPKPKRRYLVTSSEDEARRTIEKQVSQLVQLNEDHAYTYDRETLIAMLDEALKQSHVRREKYNAGG